MKKNDILQVKIIDIGINGEGIARENDMVIFIPFALKDEVVEVLVLKVLKNYTYAKLLRVITASSERITPPCQVFGKCGGCNLQHTTYKSQLIIKTNLVHNTLKKMLKTDIVVQNTIGSDCEYRYRNKMQFPINEQGIGMYALNSHRLIPLEDCLISNEAGKKIISIIKEYMQISKVKPYNEETNSGILRNVLARVSCNQDIMVTLVCTRKPPQLEIIDNLLAKNFTNYGLYYNINAQKGNKILGDLFVYISGDKEQQNEAFGIKYTLLPLSFAQVNDCIQNKIYAKVCELVEGEIVIDAYSGAGLLSAILAKRAKKVYGIEIIKEATKNANDLAELNSCDNLININGDCAVELPLLLDKIPASTVVLDPPRKGCDKRVIDALLLHKPNKIIYISCNPASLARDVSMLEKDFNITLIQPYDMFPQTKHIETLMCLQKK